MHCTVYSNTICLNSRLNHPNVVISEARNERFAKISALTEESKEIDKNRKTQQALIDSVDKVYQTCDKSIIAKYYQQGFDVPSINITRGMILHSYHKNRHPICQRFFATVHATNGFTQVRGRNNR